MIATLWLLTITLITATECVYSPPSLVKYRRLDNTAFGIQDDFIPEKRSKPSLSIVNPLDVLRQRLLLEIARRQMRENSKQVEINRAILKNVGKRGYNNERPQTTFERERFEPFQEQPDFNSFINSVVEAAATRTNYQPLNVQSSPDYYFDESNIMDARPQYPSRFNAFSRFNINDDLNDAQIDDQANRSTEEDLLWNNDKQQRLQQLKKQQRLNGQHKHFLRQWETKQINDKAQVQQHQEQEQQPHHDQPEQQQQRHPENKQQSKSFDNNEQQYMLQSFDSN